MFRFSVSKQNSCKRHLLNQGKNKDEWIFLWHGSAWLVTRHVVRTKPNFLACFVFQIAYWIHCFPELYFQKVKKVRNCSLILWCNISLGFQLNLPHGPTTLTAAPINCSASRVWTPTISRVMSNKANLCGWSAGELKLSSYNKMSNLFTVSWHLMPAGEKLIYSV